MDWEDLRHFIAAARSGSLAAAGRALGVEHTTVSRRLSALEERFGARLLDRTRSGLRLTAAGDALLRRAAAAETTMAEIERLAGTFDEALAGEVLLATSSVLAEALVVPSLPSLRAAYPHISLRLAVAKRLADLPRREAEVALRLRPPGAPVAEGEVVAARLGEASFGLYGTGKVPLADGRGLQLVRYSTPWEPGAAWLAEHLPRAAVALVADDMPTVRAACAAGVGLAVLPDFFARLTPLKRLAARCDAAGVFVAVRPDLRRTPRVRAVVRWLKDAVPPRLASDAAVEGA